MGHARTALDLLLPDLIDVADLATRLNRSRRCVRQLLRRGDLPGKKIGGRWVILRIELLRSLSPNSIPSLAPSALRLVRPATTGED